MTDLISRDEVIGKLKKAYFDKNLQEAKNDPCVIDAMTDWAIRQVKEVPSAFPWHTGTPTEEGLYLTVIKIDDGGRRYCYAYEPVYWKDGWCFRHFTNPIIAWQKIIPFEASNLEDNMLYQLCVAQAEANPDSEGEEKI